MNEPLTLMIKQANLVLPNAYAPYSGYSVGCCLSTVDGELFSGVNVENSAYALTVCAETSAICQMVAAGKKKIKSMVILAHDNKLCPPCGGCRQRIYEFSTEKTQIHLCHQHGLIQTLTINELLPVAFHLSRLHG